MGSVSNSQHFTHTQSDVDVCISTESLPVGWSPGQVAPTGERYRAQLTALWLLGGFPPPGIACVPPLRHRVHQRKTVAVVAPSKDQLELLLHQLVSTCEGLVD